MQDLAPRTPGTGVPHGLVPDDELAAVVLAPLANNLLTANAVFLVTALCLAIASAIALIRNRRLGPTWRVAAEAQA